MKNIIITTIVLLFLSSQLWAQVDKTQLAKNIKAKYTQNYAAMAQYTWQKETQVYHEDELKLTIESENSIGTDGKPVEHITEKSSTTKEKHGIRGAIQKSESDDMKEYVQNAAKLITKYIFMSDSQMVKLFDTGTVSEMNNEYQVEAFDFLIKGDNLQFLYDMKSLECISQTVNTVMSGDEIKAEIVYKALDEVNVVDKITLHLPAKNLNVVSVNSQWAKKIQ